MLNKLGYYFILSYIEDFELDRTGDDDVRDAIVEVSADYMHLTDEQIAQALVEFRIKEHFELSF